MTRANKYRIAAVTALGLFMAILDNTIVSVTLPQMQAAFHTTYSTITWVATAYFLAQAAVISVVGYLSDRVGSKLLFISSLALFTVGSLLCAEAPTENWLFAFRVFQGIGGGALLPLAFSIIYRIFPPEERGPVTALLGIPVMLAPAFGPTIGGYLSTSFDWNAIFFINLPFGVVALIAAFLILPGRASEQETHGTARAADAARTRFDITGLVLAMVGFTTLVYGITRAGSDGLGNTTVLASIIAGVVILAAFVINELVVSDPVIDVRLLANYTFTVANIMMWVIGGVLFGSLFLLPFFFENVQHLSALSAGEYLIAQGLSMGVGMLIAGSLYNRVGPRIFAAVGLLFLAAGTYGLTNLNPATSGWSFQGWLILRGVGLGFANMPLQTLALAAVSNKAMAKASSLVTVTRMVAGAIGVSALTSYLTQQATTHGTTIGTALQAGLTTHSWTGIAQTCVQTGGATFNQSLIKNCVSQYALTQGLNDTFWAVTIICAVLIIAAIFVGRDPAIVAMKEAKARGEEVVVERVAVMAE